MSQLPWVVLVVKLQQAALQVAELVLVWPVAQMLLTIMVPKATQLTVIMLLKKLQQLTHRLLMLMLQTHQLRMLLPVTTLQKLNNFSGSNDTGFDGLQLIADKGSSSFGRPFFVRRAAASSRRL